MLLWCVFYIIKRDIKEQSNNKLKYLLVGGNNTCDALVLFEQFVKSNNIATLKSVCIEFKDNIEDLAKQIIKCYGNYNDQKPILDQLLDILHNKFNIKIPNEFYKLVETLFEKPLPEVQKIIESFVKTQLNTPLKTSLNTRTNYEKYLKYKTKYLELKKLLE